MMTHVPGWLKVTVVPETVHTSGEPELKLTVPPDVAVAATL